MLYIIVYIYIYIYIYIKLGLLLDFNMKIILIGSNQSFLAWSLRFGAIVFVIQCIIHLKIDHYENISISVDMQTTQEIYFIIFKIFIYDS
jgi:hypothetical protein